MTGPSRRTVLIGTLAAGAGIVFGVAAYRRGPANPLLRGLGPDKAAITPHVLLDADGVTLITPRADVGQGATSIQAHLLAEELDVDPATVRTAPGPASGAYYNSKAAVEWMPVAASGDGIVARGAMGISDVAGRALNLHLTGGSTTVPDAYDRLRAAGASARETIKAAAASRLGLSVDDLRTENGQVIAPGATLGYAELIPDLAGIEVVQDVPLRDPSQWRRLGRAHLRTDMADKSLGRFRYGSDMVLPDMIHATPVTNPTRGAGAGTLETTAARAMRGVIDIVPISDGVAVLADNDWRAMKAARAIVADWGGAGPTDAQMAAAHDAALDNDDFRDSRLADIGDVTTATGQAFTADYGVPYLSHAPLEPANATVLYTPDRTQVWTATQAPLFLLGTLAGITGQDKAQIEINALPAGGSFGHRFEDEWVRQATEIAMQRPGQPVRLTQSREQDMTHGFYRPMARARGRGTTEAGRVRSLDLSIAAQSVVSSQLSRARMPAVGPDVTIVAAAWDAPYVLPDRRVTGYRVPSLVPVSSWRSVGASFNGFFLETLMDELIAKAGADPVEERLRLLEEPRARRVLEEVADMASWNGPDGRFGVALTFAFGVPVAQIAEVRNTAGGIVIDNLWIAADLGRVLDPVNIDAQLSGAALFGIGHAIGAEITFPEGTPHQTNFHTYQSLRLWQAPTVTTRALGLGGDIRGAGEPGLPAAAPALGNAVFAATGQRLRQMPFNRSVAFA
ncbi:molybdopterin cofactor-binding domain-containing protein [Jannaschia sp. 2305UL9-9]|uniref:xanthine dehydrogenase family protein molybdopterin-binding subunit n=1 Tax=Jannaschia sp. 2305UL9-9 TaxID=3121638 RepID=UPI003528C4F0